MNTPDQDDFDFDPTPYIVPIDQGAPNPYEADDFDGKQDEVTDDNKVEGLGGNTFAESPLNINDALSRLHDLVTSHATKMWSGLPIKGYCLAVQHEASEIGALHATAWQDWQENPDQHPGTYDTIDWTKVPRGAWCYNSSGAGGSGAGHIYRFCGIHNGKPIFCSNDVIPGQMAYLDDARWFLQHWGQELVGWSRVCNGVWQHGISGNDDGGQGQGKGNGWPGATEARVAVGILHNQILPAVEKVQGIATGHDQAPVWADAAKRLAAVSKEVRSIHDELEAVTPPAK